MPLEPVSISGGSPTLDRVLAAGVIVVALTEGLSRFHALDRPTVLVAWGIIGALALAARGLRGWSWPAVHPAVGGILGLTAFVALVSPPNGWDALSYHMSRVVYWIQNASVAHFPTHNIRQVSFPPFAEFCLLHLQLLWGGDRLANLVQWGGFAGSLIAVAELSRRCGAGPAAAGAAGLFAATLPMAILQASGTENDLVLSLWLLIAVLAAEENLRTGTVTSALKLGAATGLAALTKGTAYVVGGPLLAGWVALLLVRRTAWRRLLASIAAAALVALALNAPHYWRNARLFGHPLGDQALTALHENRMHSAAMLASNLARNASLHLVTPLPPLNDALRGALEALHARLGLGTSDPRTTFLEAPLFLVFALHEDWAGAPLHFVAIVVVLAAVVARRLWPGRGAVSCLALGVTGFVAMSWLLKWQPWGARLQVSLFLIAAVPCGLAAARALSPRSLGWLSALFVIASVPYVVANGARPLVTGREGASQNILSHSRSVLYLPARLVVPAADVPGEGDPLAHTLPRVSGRTERWAVRASYLGATEVLRRSGCRHVGLIQAIDSWDYPLWALARQRGFALGIRQVEVRNRTAVLAPGPPDIPCAIVVLDSPMKFPVPRPAGLEGDEIYRSRPVTIVVPHSRR